MEKNKIVIYITLIALIFIIGCPTIYKVVKNHQNKLNLITEKRIVEAAKKCWNDDVCTNNSITLKELYDNKYLEKQADPITKKYYNELSKITKKEGKIKFYPE